MDISKTKMADLGTMMGGSPSAESGPELAAGKVIGDRYEITGILGRGGMGVVYEASDNLGQTQVALKFLRPELVSNDTAIQRFLNEARIVRDLSHPNIVRVYDVSRYENTYFLSMERLEGKSLRQVMEDLKSRGEPMPIAQAIGITRDLARALEYAHQSTIHRDIKPENIWLQPNGKAKLMDFGIARLQSQTQGLTKVASALGTAYYMAPEQLVGSGSVDARADQYALGVMLYEMLTGALPLARSGSASSRRLGLSKKMDELVDRLLAGRAEDRYPDAAALLKGLDALPTSEPGRTKTKPPRPTANADARPDTAWKRPVIAAAVAAALAAGGWGYTEWQQAREQERIAAEADAKRKAEESAAADAKRKADLVAAGVVLPEMLPIAGGTFRMGDLRGKGYPGEKPVHSVTVKPFSLGKHEVTFAEWDGCVKGGGCKHRPGDEGWGRGNRPVINVSWNDIQQFIKWLNEKTGERYRLPTEAEWEYAARGGTETDYSFGNSVSCGQANYDGCKGKTVEVGSYSANPWGLHDMHGNVWEWTEDCWHDHYRGAPADGSAWTSGGCDRRVLRGGGRVDDPEVLRSAGRNWYAPADRFSDGGFRLARTE